MKLIIFIITLIPVLANSQQTLQLKEIMAGNDFIGHQPNSIVWSPCNKEVFFSWQQNGAKSSSYYSVKDGNTPTMLSDSMRYHAAINGYQTNDQKTAFYFQNNHKIFFVGPKGNELIYESASNFRLHAVIDEHKVMIKQGQQFYLYNHSKGLLKQCVNFKTAEEKEETAPNYLERQQLELFEFIRDEQAEKQAKTDEKAIAKKYAIPSFMLNKKSVGLFTVNTRVDFVLVRTDDYPKNKNTEIEDNVTASGYSEKVNARPKVGAKDPTHELFWIDLKTGESDLIDIKNLPGIHTKPAYLKLYNDTLDLERNTPKNIIYTQVKMNTKGNLALIEIKSYDNKDRWIAIFNTSTKKLTCADHQHSDEWIGGPGISGWNMVPGNIGWLNDGQTVYFQSEKSGYSHLYTYNVNSSKTTALTDGNFEIHEATLAKAGDKFYVTANKNAPGNREFYHLEITNKKWTPILTKNGNYEVTISPNEDQLAVRYSYKNKPWELYLAPNKKGAQMVQVTKSTTKDFKNYQWREPEIVTFKNKKGIDVYARLFKPDPSKSNGAAIQFVHGAGYLQNAHNWWSGYYREYMFHNLLVDKGYTVIDIDFTASKGYGREFRTGIYRHMGGQDLDDQIAGRQYLINEHGIKPEKVGIYGGSYGGFITIMALLKYPGYFQCGAAIRSVTDWAHYNHPYTSNILNTPDKDSVAFRQSSPIYFADKLEDELLILHGMMDDNVQFQDVVRLNQRFIELGKQSFTMALYPVEPHGFVKTSSWVDEYSRILSLFTQHLLE